MTWFSEAWITAPCEETPPIEEAFRVARISTLRCLSASPHHPYLSIHLSPLVFVFLVSLSSRCFYSILVSPPPLSLPLSLLLLPLSLRSSRHFLISSSTAGTAKPATHPLHLMYSHLPPVCTLEQLLGRGRTREKET